MSPLDPPEDWSSDQCTCAATVVVDACGSDDAATDLLCRTAALCCPEGEGAESLWCTEAECVSAPWCLCCCCGTDLDRCA